LEYANYIIPIIAACAASLLTFFSGFGLGTLLTPVFALFFPIEISIALTGIVHFLNNIFKLGLTYRHVDWAVATRFGIPAFAASFAGALLLSSLSYLEPITRWGPDDVFVITPVKVIIGLLLLFFALMEVLPILKRIQFGRKHLVAGGIASGFFGGLSGHQGALRSAFLVRAELTKEAFIATGIVIACLVDVSRLGVYITRFKESAIGDNLILVAMATLSAFAGAYAGSKLLHKVTMRWIQYLVTVLLLSISVLLGLGII